MPQQVHATPTRTTAKSSSAEMEQLATDDTTAERDSAEEILDETDELLDEIDAVLEEAAVAVTYRQRGGE